MKFVHYLQWEGAALSALEPRFPDVRFVGVATAERAVAELADADCFAVAGPFYPGKVARAVCEAAPKLRWMQTTSIGTDKFDQGGVPHGLQFTNAAGLKGATVAEHAVAMLLGLVHALPQMERFRFDRHWGRQELRTQISTLEGRTLLLPGYGSIGREIARKAKAFDMHVVAFNSTGTGEGPADEVHAIAALPGWLPAADVIACSLPITPETKGLLGAEEFGAMKPGAIIVNVGRGAVIDHDALLHALREGRLAGACLDVFDQEPLPPEDAFWNMENVVLSPHVAGSGGPLGRMFADLVAENLSRLRDGRPLKNLVQAGA
jgi:phosphoglycerate dehydrogenase-like enzyme